MEQASYHRPFLSPSKKEKGTDERDPFDTAVSWALARQEEMVQG